ncbi:MAG TPA: DMT family transporter [Thermoleophilaceae bacterium]|nr:DMT family transporter [Thermoleophilaceae bacterium]
MTGALWAAASGIGFGLFQGLNRRAVRDIGDPYASTFLQLAVAAAVLVGVTFAAGEQTAVGDASAWGIAAFALAGIVHFLGGWTFLNISQVRIGAARTSPLLTTAPVFGVAAAAIVYQQFPSSIALLTMVPMVAGAYLVSTRTRAVDVGWRESLPGLATALMWGVSPVLTVEGLKTLHSPLAGVTIGMVAAVCAYGVALVWRGTGLELGAIARDALTLKVAAAVLVAIATWWRWLALDHTTVAVVLALNLLSVPVVLFVAPLLVGRHVEHVTARVVLGAALVVAGALALILVG